MIEPTYDPAWTTDPELAASVAARDLEEMAAEREERDRAAFQRGQTVEPPTLRVVEETPDPRDDPDFEHADIDLDRVTALVHPADAAGPAAEAQEPDDCPEPPEEAAYHGVLGDITRAVEEQTEADPVGVLGTLLTMFGSACGGSRWLYQGSMQRTNLSMLLVGDTAVGRKGTALSIARAAFRLVDPALEGLWLPGVASGEGLAGHIQRLQGEHPDEERVLVVEPEFGRLLAVMNRDGSTLSPILRNTWDGVPLGHSRARDESLVTRHHVSLIGHITPPELRAKLSDAANGFADRVLFLAVRRPRLIPFPSSPDGFVEPYVADLRRAIDAAHRQTLPRRSTAIRLVRGYVPASSSVTSGIERSRTPSLMILSTPGSTVSVTSSTPATMSVLTEVCSWAATATVEPVSRPMAMVAMRGALDFLTALSLGLETGTTPAGGD